MHNIILTYNQLIIYQVIKPIWLDGTQLWRCAKETNIKLVHTFQTKLLRNMVKAPLFIRNQAIHREIGIVMVNKKKSKALLETTRPYQ